MTRPRLAGLDLARSIAMLGMLVVNFKLLVGHTGGGRGLAKALSLLEGKAAALFVVAAGVGVSLLARAAGGRSALVARGAVLFVAGLAFAAVWPADILHFYGVYLGVAAVFVTWRSRSVAWVAVAFALGFVALLLVLDYEAHWDWNTLEYAGFWTTDGMIRHLLFNGFHPLFPWMSFLLLGVLVGRLNLASPAVHERLGMVAAAVFSATEFVSAVVGTELAGTQMMPPLPIYLLNAGSVAVLVLAVSLAVGRRFASSSAVGALAHGGQLSLTIYLAHVVVGIPILHALGWISGGTTAGVILVFSIAFWLATVAVATAIRRRWRRGPAEWLLREVAALLTTNPRKGTS